ncbi:hypothetical protein J437_LFUL007966 [Ladona fulva]|uniref:G-protein coupled receptors family 1 profile domain-containing protein n=1 Tax=Ladona fulva TaxID=123851 RepID=A0A8K0K4X8_LADFU|nr:hypothetical protein J437_LFUL007966 [Ladona fulva]
MYLDIHIYFAIKIGNGDVILLGNVFVIAAILLERHLQSVANYLIVSLAVADLMVACLVMPLGAVYAISQGWILGPELCDMWTSSDVLCCTASILHLVAIAVDRLHPHPEQQPNLRDDSRGVDSGAGRLLGSSVRVEGPRLFGPHQPPAAMPRQPGCGLPNIRHLLHFLRPSSRHPRPLLEDLSDCQEANPPSDQQDERSQAPLRAFCPQEGSRRGRGGRGGSRGNLHVDYRVYSRGGGAEEGKRGGGRGPRLGCPRDDGVHHHYVRDGDDGHREPRRGSHGGRASGGAQEVLVQEVGRKGQGRQGEEGEPGGEERTQGGQDAGHHHGGVRRVLVALLHHGASDAVVRLVHHQRTRGHLLPLAGILQFHAQPRHLYHLQPRV